MSTNFGVIFKTINKNKYQVITTIIGSVVMLAVSYIFLSNLGAYAVAIGQMLSALAMLLSRYFISRKFVEYSINWLPIIALIGVYAIVCIASIYSTLIITSIVMMITIIFALIINKDFIKEIFKRRKN